MNTKSDMPDGGRMDITVKVTNKTIPSQSKRSWKISLEDINGSPIQLILWSTHSIDGSEISVGEWYELTDVRSQQWNKQLHSTSDMTAKKVPAPETRSTNILHISDTHIGYPLRERSDQYNQSTVRWIDEIDCLTQFRKAMEMAVEREVDAVIHTGDVFDDVVDTDHLNEFRDILENTVGEADIPFYYILGNHDPENARMELKSAESAGLAKHLSRRTPTQVGENVFLYGTDYHKPDWWENPPSKFDDGVPEGSYRVLCLHESISPVCPSRKRSADIPLERIVESSNIDFDLIALGHEHDVHEERYPSGYDCMAFYPGPAERISNKYRDKPASVNLYTFSEDITRERLEVT
jgi:DNA repair exonuclease SbcCD nuclease subunit